MMKILSSMKHLCHFAVDSLDSFVCCFFSRQRWSIKVRYFLVTNKSNWGFRSSRNSHSNKKRSLDQGVTAVRMLDQVVRAIRMLDQMVTAVIKLYNHPKESNISVPYEKVVGPVYLLCDLLTKSVSQDISRWLWQLNEHTTDCYHCCFIQYCWSVNYIWEFYWLFSVNLKHRFSYLCWVLNCVQRQKVEFIWEGILRTVTHLTALIAQCVPGHCVCLSRLNVCCFV